MADLYGEHILDHYRHPRNKGALAGANASAHEENPLCGDVLDIQLRVDGAGVVEDVRFEGSGCAVSQAAASMLTEAVKGKAVDDVKRLSKGDVFALLGVPVNPARAKCALLPLKAVKLAVYGREGLELPDDPLRD